MKFDCKKCWEMLIAWPDSKCYNCDKISKEEKKESKENLAKEVTFKVIDDGINYAIDGDQVCATYDNFKNPQESVAWFGKTQEEAKADLLANSKKWFCTIFEKKNNRAIVTIPIVWKFTEDHARAYAINNWILWEIKATKEQKKEMEKEMLDFINWKLDPVKHKELIYWLTEMFKIFNGKYRILIGN